VSLDLGADRDRCNAFLVFEVESAEVDGVDVSGLTVAAMIDAALPKGQRSRQHHARASALVAGNPLQLRNFTAPATPRQRSIADPCDVARSCR
jgi:hypothetical protein